MSSFELLEGCFNLIDDAFLPSPDIFQPKILAVLENRHIRAPADIYALVYCNYGPNDQSE